MKYNRKLQNTYLNLLEKNVCECPNEGCNEVRLTIWIWMKVKGTTRAFAKGIAKSQLFPCETVALQVNISQFIWIFKFSISVSLTVLLPSPGCDPDDYHMLYYHLYFLLLFIYYFDYLFQCENKFDCPHDEICVLERSGKK